MVISNKKLKMVMVSCISIVFFINSLVNIDILMHDKSDVRSAFVARVSFVIIDFLMAFWLMYNVKREFDASTFIGLMIVHTVATPSTINSIVNSNRV